MRMCVFRLFGLFLVFAVGMASICLDNTTASAANGWIGGGAPNSSVYGGGGGGGSCSGELGYYDLACTGYSWIYYKYIGGNAGKNQGIYFRRDGYIEDLGFNSATNNLISKECSNHGEDGGFWHLGYNMKGLSYGSDIYVFADWHQAKGLSNETYVYSTGPSKWGHALTFQYNTIPAYYKSFGGEKTYSNGSLNQVIYKKIGDNYIPMYQAVKFGNPRGNVLSDYKQAYKRVNGSNYNGSSMPGDVYAFCSWPVEEDNFVGQARVFEGANMGDASGKASTGYVSSGDKTANLEIECPDSGCWASFSLDLVRKKGGVGNKNVTYTVRRSANGTQKTILTKTTNAIKTEGTTGSPGVYQRHGTSGNTMAERLKPGDEVCYSLEFNNNSGNSSGKSTVKACAKAVKKPENYKYAGRARILELNDGGTAWTVKSESDKSGTTGFTYKENKKVKVILSCPMTGCDTTFSLDVVKLMQDNNDPTNYNIYRFKNGTKTEIIRTNDKGEGVQFNRPVEGANNAILRDNNTELHGTVKPRYRLDNSHIASVYWIKERMVPGDEVCYKMVTKVSDNKATATVEACVDAVNDGGDYETLLDMKVRNDTLDTDYVEKVYAKPGDKLTYRSTYEPLAQAAIDFRVGEMEIREKDYSYKTISNVNNKTIKDLFNENRGEFAEWNNDYFVSKSGFSELYSGGYTYNGRASDSEKIAPGDASRKSLDDEYVVGVGDVGATLEETAEINPSSNSGVWTTPAKVSFETKDVENMIGVVDVSNQGASASADVPYNFTNTISMGEINKTIYAGEDVGIEYEVQVHPRQNNETNGNYATIVKKAKIQVVMCEGEGCTNDKNLLPVNGSSQETDLNSSGNKDGYSDPKPRTATVPIPDSSAGTTMCFKSRLYPKEVLNDTTVSVVWGDYPREVLDDDGSVIGMDYGSYEWAESEERCYKVAKKPSFQVWGGSIYSAKDVGIPLAVKKRLADYNDGTYTFGSWAELGVVAGGKITGLASGAGLGYSGLNFWADPGGGGSSNYCDMSTLSFANADCGNNKVGGLGTSSVGSGDKSALVARFSDENADDYKLVKLTEDKNISELDIEWRNNDGKIEFSKTEEKKTLVINAGEKGKDIIINENITYKKDGHTSLEDIPKIIIYAKNIRINCNVTRIDAVLIADGSINDCIDSDNINSKDNSTQLIINGSVIADKLELKRTYGAATGANSIVPAEIINYDSSLYLWANKQADVTTSGKLTEASTSELAPRY